MLFCIWHNKVIFWQTTDIVLLESGTIITIWVTVLTVVYEILLKKLQQIMSRNILIINSLPNPIGKWILK